MDKNQEAKVQTYWRLLKYVKPYWFRMTMGILAGFVVGGSLFGSLMLVPSLMSGIEFSGGGGNEKKVSAQEIVAAVRNSPGEAAGVAAALAAKRNVSPGDLPYEDIAERLIRRGVKLHLSDVGLAGR